MDTTNPLFITGLSCLIFTIILIACFFLYSLWLSPEFQYPKPKFITNDPIISPLTEISVNTAKSGETEIFRFANSIGMRLPNIASPSLDYFDYYDVLTIQGFWVQSSGFHFFTNLIFTRFGNIGVFSFPVFPTYLISPFEDLTFSGPLDPNFLPTNFNGSTLWILNSPATSSALARLNITKNSISIIFFPSNTYQDNLIYTTAPTWSTFFYLIS